MTRPTTRSKIRTNTMPGRRFADEKIIEFSSPNGGGLIAFLLRGDRLIVEPYRLDDTVDINPPLPADLGAALRAAEEALVVADRKTGTGTLGENAVGDLLHRLREVISQVTPADTATATDDERGPAS